MASEIQIRTKIQTESKSDKVKIDGLPRIGIYAVEQIRKKIIEKKITASGRTQQSIGYRITGEKGLTIFAASGERAPISTLQYGRAGGKTPRGFVETIKEWVKVKGITYKSIPYKRQPSEKWKPKYTAEECGLNSLAGAIASKIKKEGTKRYKENEEVYSPVLDEVVELFTNFIAKEQKENIIKTLIK